MEAARRNTRSGKNHQAKTKAYKQNQKEKTNQNQTKPSHTRCKKKADNEGNMIKKGSRECNAWDEAESMNWQKKKGGEIRKFGTNHLITDGINKAFT